MEWEEEMDEREGEGEDQEDWYWEDDIPTPVSKAWWIDLTAQE